MANTMAVKIKILPIRKKSNRLPGTTKDKFFIILLIGLL